MLLYYYISSEALRCCTYLLDITVLSALFFYAFDKYFAAELMILEH